MVVFGNWQNLPALIAATGRVEAQAAFHYPPAIVLTARTAGRLNINFFPGRLPYVSDVKIMGQTVKGESPWISETIGPNFLSDVRIGAGKKRIGRWDPIRRTGIHIQAQDLAEQAI